MLPLCFSAFVCFGMVLVLVGANQAEIAGGLHLDLAQSGLLGSALAVGLGIGFVAAGPLFDRLPQGPLSMGATLLAGGALLSVDGSVGYGRLLLHIVVTGLGIACYATFNNALVVESHREHAARPMLIAHAAATVGAMLGPALIGALAARHPWTASFQWTGAAHLGIAAWACFAPFPAPAASITVPAGAPARGLRAFLPGLWPFALIAFAYVGIESTLIVFAVPYAADGLGLPPEHGRAAISGLWFGLLAGRLLGVALPGRRGPRLLIVAGALGAGCLLAGAVSASIHVVALFGVVGFVLGCVYPLMTALVGQQFPRAPGTAAGLAAAAGALGGSLVPWLSGVIGNASGVATAIGSMAVCSLAIAAGGIAAARRPTPPIVPVA